MSHSKPHAYTQNSDDREATRWIRDFLAGSVSMLEIPAWVLVKRRCKGRNQRGRCTQAVLIPDKDLCFYCQQQKDGYVLSVDDDPTLAYLLEETDEGDWQLS